MTKSFNRLSIKEIFARKEYVELAQIICKDTEILNSWERISGLGEKDDGKKWSKINNWEEVCKFKSKYLNKF